MHLTLAFIPFKVEANNSLIFFLLLQTYEKKSAKFRSCRIYIFLLAYHYTPGVFCSVCSKAILNLTAKYFGLPLFSVFIYRCRYGGYTEAVKRILAQLPISAQSYSSSPYLDLTLFSYDDKWVSVMERPKTCDGYPIRSLFLHFLLKLTIVYSRQLVPRFYSIKAHSHEHEITTETSDGKAA